MCFKIYFFPNQIHTQNLTGAPEMSTNLSQIQHSNWHVISGDMLRLAYAKPQVSRMQFHNISMPVYFHTLPIFQVEVYINGYPSKCVGQCQFETSESVTPIVRSISPNSGSRESTLS